MGKTTLLRLIAGLESLDGRGDGGRIWLGGKEISQVPVHLRGIGFVFQEQALFSGRSVSQNIGFALELKGVAKDEREKRIAEWTSRLGLSGRENETVDVMSGGERQRIALARALISRPRLILMDEPFVGMDSRLRAELREEILRIHTALSVPLLFVSHDEADSEKLATARLEIRESAGGVRSVTRID